MLINIQQLKTSLQAVKNYIDNKLPKKVSELDNDTGFITNTDISGKANTSDLATVATSGSYEDLTNKPTIPSVPVTDVQINETSILSNGVANIPIASGTDFGVAKVNPTYGIGLYDGFLILNNATSQDIKNGNNSAKAVSAYRQHESTFYGLAKAAGVSMSSSDNPVGTYTDAAKTAIKTMLGVTDPTVSDVQINGTSIISNGVANILTASVNNSGVVKVSPTYGLDIGSTNQHMGFIRIYPPLDGYIKKGEGYYNPVTVSKQHQAVFYGLAKAAGDTTQSTSSNTIGTYTNEAKTAIKSMLGVPNYSYDLSEGELLPANADISSYTTPGIYYADDSTAGTISTSPTDLRFKLIVEKINDKDVRQTIVDYMGRNFTTIIDTVSHGYLMWSRVATDIDLSYMVQDVQINGASIISNGVANIIGATAQNFGVIKFGQGFKTDNSTGATGIDWASADNIKVGTSQYKAINPYAQHRAVFYGLAKAAGDTTQALSDNAVGTYTTEAKTAIKSMIGVPTNVSEFTNDAGYITAAQVPPSAPEIYIGTTTPSGYSLYIDPTGTNTVAEGVSF